MGRFAEFTLTREGVDREKLTVKKIINNEIFFSPFMSLINHEKLCVNREKDRHQKSTVFSPLVFHRLRPHVDGLSSFLKILENSPSRKGPLRGSWPVLPVQTFSLSSKRKAPENAEICSAEDSHAEYFPPRRRQRARKIFREKRKGNN